MNVIIYNQHDWNGVSCWLVFCIYCGCSDRIWEINIGAMEKRKRTIIRCICFWLIFIYFFIHISYVLRRDSDMKERFSGFYAIENNSLDMVMIGSSPVHPYWCAPLAYGEHGFASYPISTNVQQPRMTFF